MRRGGWLGMVSALALALGMAAPSPGADVVVGGVNGRDGVDGADNAPGQPGTDATDGSPATALAIGGDTSERAVAIAGHGGRGGDGGDSPAYPELLQHRASARGLAEQALTLLRDDAALARLSDAGARVRTQLTSGATSDAVADDILALARTHPPPARAP